MEFNFHPLLVHFPVAFFTLYGVLELLSFLKFFKNSYWFYIKAVLVTLGVISAGFAVIAGQLIEKNKDFESVQDLVELHSKINEIAIFVFFVIAVCYVVEWLRKDNVKFLPKALMDLGVKLKSFVLDTPLIYILSLVGLILITIGGALGGAIAYGKDIDPFVSFIYSLFFH